jgi:hypothetical protein
MAEEKINCPICNKSDQVIPVIYGLPTEKLFKLAKEGVYALGGCVLRESNPTWYCKRDKFHF